MDTEPTTISESLAQLSGKIQSRPAGPKSGAPDRQLISRGWMRQCPNKVRTVAKIEPELLALMRELLSGRWSWPLFLFGSAGTGKTCAALCLLDCLGGRYYALPNLLDDLIQAMQGRLYTATGYKMFPEGIWQRVVEAPLVVLDEIGCREKVSDAHYEALKRLLDFRDGCPLVAISNLEPEALRRLYDDRVYSRLMKGVVWDASGKDRRLT